MQLKQSSARYRVYPLQKEQSTWITKTKPNAAVSKNTWSLWCDHEVFPFASNILLWRKWDTTNPNHKQNSRELRKWHSIKFSVNYECHWLEDNKIMQCHKNTNKNCSRDSWLKQLFKMRPQHRKWHLEIPDIYANSIPFVICCFLAR